MPTTYSTTQRRLLEATRAAVHNTAVSWNAPIAEGDWDALMQSATAHKLLPLVFEAVHTAPAAATLAAPYRRQVIAQVMGQTMRSGEFIALYRALQEAGVHPLVVKGIVCRGLYAKGDHRISADEDLLVSPPEFAAACRVLRGFGMVPSGDDSQPVFELGWRKADTGLYIELHTALFPPDAGAYGELNRFFTDSAARATEYPTPQGETVASLCPHDHLLYLLLHAYKHFIHSGFGIRQVCDIGLWAAHYAPRIDWDTLYTQCRDVHALTFSAAVLGIARTHLGIAIPLPTAWDVLHPDPEPMLQDLLAAGVYGSADRGRLHSASVTLHAVEAQRTHIRTGVWQTVFPKRETMTARYPVLKRHPYLLPACWLHRLVKYSKETRSSGNGNCAAESLRIARERTALLRMYDILE